MGKLSENSGFFWIEPMKFDDVFLILASGKLTYVDPYFIANF
jgi:hypothetical protein